MSLIYLALAFGFGYLAGTKRLLKFILPANPITQALDAEQDAMKNRMVQTVLQQMRTQAPAPTSVPPSQN